MATQQISATALGGLRPLVSDLLTTTAPKNSFLAPTITGDATAIQNRLNEYEAYDPKKLQGVASYLSPYVAATNKGIQYFKKGAVNDALSQLTTLEDMGLTSTPLSEDTKPVATVDGKQFYRRSSLADEASARDQGVLSRIASSYGLSGYQPKTWTPTTETQTRYGNMDGENVGWRDEQVERPITRDELINATLAGQSLDYQKIFPIIPRSNEIIPHNPAFGQLAEQFDSVYTSKPTRQLMESAGKALGLSSDQVNKLGGLTAAKLYQNSFNTGYEPWQMGYYDATSPYINTLSDYYKQAYGKDLPSGVRDYLTGASSQISQNFGSARDIQSHSGGFFSDALPMISAVLKFTPLAPAAYAYDAYNAIRNKSPLGLIGAALGAYGQFNPSFNPANALGGWVNQSLDLGLGKLGQSVLGGGMMGAGMGALQGGLKGALAGGLTGGLGSYLAPTFASLSQGSPLAQAALGIGSNAGLGALNAVLSGKNVQQGLMGGLAGGLANVASGALSQSLGKPFGTVSNPIIRQALAKQLYH